MLVKCKECNGEGFVFSEELKFGFTCSACKGKGGFDVPEGKEICPECKGSGHVVVIPEGWGIGIQQNCKNCYATGFVDKETNNN